MSGFHPPLRAPIVTTVETNVSTFVPTLPSLAEYIAQVKKECPTASEMEYLFHATAIAATRRDIDQEVMFHDHGRIR